MSLQAVTEDLASLVAFRTVAGEPNGELVAWIAERLAGDGVDCTEVQSSSREDARNLLATVGPPDRPGIVLAAHTDVVAVEDQQWRGDPFSLTRVGDRLHGRGTADMKGFIAVALHACREARARNLRRPLHLALSSDEELGCLGVGSLLELIASTVARPVTCLVGEPTLMRPADRHKGKVSVVVEVRGRTGHSSAAPRAVNAVTHAGRLIAALDEQARELARGPGDPAFDVPRATLSVGAIRGGVSTNIVPDRCTFSFELRYLPGQDPEPILERVRARARELEGEMRAVAPEAAIELAEVAAYPPLAPAGTTGMPSWLPAGGAPIAVDFGTEAGLYRERLGAPVVVCGPGSMEQAHRPDEYVELAQLQAAQGLLRAVVDELAVP